MGLYLRLVSVGLSLGQLYRNVYSLLCAEKLRKHFHVVESRWHVAYRGFIVSPNNLSAIWTYLNNSRKESVLGDCGSLDASILKNCDVFIVVDKSVRVCIHRLVCSKTKLRWRH
mgnify:CR=1 FL=1